VSQTFESRLGGYIRRFRCELGLDITGLANDISVPLIRLMGIETGAVRPTAEELYDIASALGVTISELFKDAHPTPQ